MNFKSGTALAVQQDTLIASYNRGEKISKEVLDDLKNNWWVKTAFVTAPSNLVVRHLALIDLIEGKPGHANDIINLIEKLTYTRADILINRLWAEGYSYFCYTMDILGVWLNKFNNFTVQSMIRYTELGFIATSYLREGAYYPALFGDLRVQPLNPSLQIIHPIETQVISFVKMIVMDGVIIYSCDAWPLGFNAHIGTKKTTAKVIGGVVYDFNFYNGYDKKYPNKFAEFVDTFNPIRIGSLL